MRERRIENATVTNVGEKAICHQVRERINLLPSVGGERKIIHLSQSVREKDRESICHQVSGEKER